MSRTVMLVQLPKKEKEADWQAAKLAIEKLINSKNPNTFSNGHNGLQAYRARAIQSLLWMVVDNGKSMIEASEQAAESNGFSVKWGGRMVRRWARAWIEKRELPSSARGAHLKSYSLLDDPSIRAELRSYLRSNKWATDPVKVAEYSKLEMIPAAAEKFIRHIVDEEMPRGLMKYMQVELFPRIHMKASGKGISIETARRFLYKEGFRYEEHKKALYYDGHERPDVVAYRQNEFLPAMAKYRKRLVEYMIGDVSKKIQKANDSLADGLELVLVSHDEMTTQANNGKKKSWVPAGEFPIKKKGVGRGLHTSQVVCSTKGLLPEAGRNN